MRWDVGMREMVSNVFSSSGRSLSVSSPIRGSPQEFEQEMTTHRSQDALMIH